MAEPSAPWYGKGLRFACQGCGACCRVEGHVWVGEAEIRRLADSLDLNPDAFGRRYLRQVGERYSLIEKANHDCVFWHDGCLVYEARPRQCRTFPFWPECLESREAWASAAEDCGGIDRGKLYRLEEIRLLATGKAETGTGPTSSCSCNDQ